MTFFIPVVADLDINIILSLLLDYRRYGNNKLTVAGSACEIDFNETSRREVTIVGEAVKLRYVACLHGKFI